MERRGVTSLTTGRPRSTLKRNKCPRAVDSNVEELKHPGAPAGVGAGGDGNAAPARQKERGCGFGASEIAGAFLAGRAAIEKRISRGKKVLASSRRLFDLAEAEFSSRLSAVRRALYLLFNEGYHGACWDARLVAQGLALLERSAAGDELTAYHVEAAIAAAHAGAPSVPETDWESIVSLYDRLMTIAPSPVVALNRAIAIAQRDGAQRGMDELDAIEGRDRLKSYPFYPAAMGELELRRGNRQAAGKQFKAALALARNPAERRFLENGFGRAKALR